MPELKKRHTELDEVYSKVLQYENYRLHSNILTLYNLKKNGRKVGKLRFRGKDWFKTFTYNQSGFKIIPTGRRFQTLHLSKIGEIPIRMHRNVTGKVKQVTVKHTPSGKWFACLAVETNKGIKATQSGKKVGIDLGLDNYIFDSDGNRVSHPKYLYKSMEKLGKEQGKLSNRKKGSKNRIKQKIKVARVHERIVNQRDDFLHKLSRHYVNKYGFIAFEKLNIKNMVRNHRLSKSIADASWNKFLQMLRYKAESAGVRAVEIDPGMTTQKCSECGRIARKSLSVRTHKCKCGFIADRDYNSALNILAKAIGQELPEFTPVDFPCINNKVHAEARKVETEPLLLSNQEQVWSMKQDATRL